MVYFIVKVFMSKMCLILFCTCVLFGSFIISAMDCPAGSNQLILGKLKNSFVPDGVRPESWAFVLSQLHNTFEKLNMQQQLVSTVELIAIMRALPRSIRKEIRELNLAGHSIEDLPADVLEFSQMHPIVLDMGDSVWKITYNKVTVSFD